MLLFKEHPTIIIFGVSSFVRSGSVKISFLISSKTCLAIVVIYFSLIGGE